MINDADTCPDRDILIDRVNGILSSEDEKRIDAHISGCAICRMEHQRLQHILALGTSAVIDDPGESFNTEVWNKINRTARLRRTGILVLPLAAAAIALFIIMKTEPPGVEDDNVIVERLDLYRHMDIIDNMDMLMKLESLLDSEDGSDI